MVAAAERFGVVVAQHQHHPVIDLRHGLEPEPTVPEIIAANAQIHRFHRPCGQQFVKASFRLRRQRLIRRNAHAIGHRIANERKAA
jgi:hypothetical protein